MYKNFSIKKKKKICVNLAKKVSVNVVSKNLKIYIYIFSYFEIGKEFWIDFVFWEGFCFYLRCRYLMIETFFFEMLSYLQILGELLGLMDNLLTVCKSLFVNTFYSTFFLKKSEMHQCD